MRDITEQGILDLLPEYPLYKKIDTIGRYTATMEEDVRLLVKLGLAISAQNILEIGTFLGETTIILSKYFSFVYTVDKDPLVKDIKESNITSIISDSADISAYDNIKLPIQLAFIDGSHTYQNVIIDTFHCLRIVEKGLIVFHDAITSGVKMALEDLSKVLNIYRIIGTGIDNVAFTIV